jgi:hypothetical protein
MTETGNNTTEQNPSWGPDRFSASEKIPWISLTPLLASATCPHPQPDHSSPCLPNPPKIYFNIIINFMPRSSKWSFSLILSTKALCNSPVYNACYMISPSNSSFDFPIWICQGCIRRTRWQKPAIIHAVKTHSHPFYFTGKNVMNKWKRLRDHFIAELNRMNANKSVDPGFSPSKWASQWSWY